MTDLEFLKMLEALIPPIIGDYGLMANPNKWEHTTLSSEQVADLWKKVRKLGSLLGDEEDIERRMNLATVQFKALNYKAVGSVGANQPTHAYAGL